MWLRMKKTWKLWRNRKFEVPPRACLKFFLYCPIASKNMDLWMKTRKQNKERDTIPFYQVMESNNNPLSSSKNIQETIQKHETSISSKAYMTIYCFYSSSSALFTMKAFGIYRPKWGKPLSSTCNLIGLSKISYFVLEALQSSRYKISHKISKKC